MKIIRNIYILGLLLGLVAFIGCSEDDLVEPAPSPEAPAGTQGVYFPSTNKSAFELMPVDPTEFELTIARSTSEGAVDVPLTQEVNDDNVFVVPSSVSFAAGETEATFKVTFPDADVGKLYNLKLSVEGDEFVNPYVEGLPYVETNAMRVEWKPVEEPMIYLDGSIMAFFGVTYEPIYVYAEKAELGDAVRYRFKNIFKPPTSENPDEDGIWDGYPYNTDNFIEGDYYTTIEIGGDKGKANEVFMFAGDIGHDWGYGMFSIGSEFGNRQTDKDDYPLGVLKDSIITFPENSLYINMVDFGTRTAGDPSTIYLSKNVYLAANLAIESFNDIEYAEDAVEDGVFKSEAYADDTWSQTLLKAIDADPDNEDSEYKDLFYLPNLYEDDFGLAFYYKNGAVLIPEAQPTGIKVFGKEVFVSQSNDIDSEYIIGSEEDYDEDLEDGDEGYDPDGGKDRYVFGLNFHYKDGTNLGNFTEKFILSEENEITPVESSRKGVTNNFEIQGKASPKVLRNKVKGSVIL